MTNLDMVSTLTRVREVYLAHLWGRQLLICLKQVLLHDCLL